MHLFFSEGLEKRLLLRERIARVGDGLWTDWSLCFVLFCIVRCGIRFFFLFPFVSTLLLFYATKEIVFFLRLIWNHSFILNFFAIDHPSILKILLRKFLQCQYPWIWFIKGSCISLYRYFHSHIFTQSIFSIRWIVSFRYKVIRFFFPRSKSWQWSAISSLLSFFNGVRCEVINIKVWNNSRVISLRFTIF